MYIVIWTRFFFMRFRTKIRLWLLVLLILVLLSKFSFKALDQYYQIVHDLKVLNPRVSSSAQIDKVLNDLETIPYSRLDQEYKNETLSNDDNYRSLLASQTYYEVYRKDLNKKLVGNFRIKQFISRDKHYNKTLLNKNKPIYWLVNPLLPKKMLELQEELKALGYDRDAFILRNSHRHPVRNQQVGGASKSRHMVGEAADLTIGDINKDGRYSEKDKQIVLDLLDEKIIGDLGGVGKYPGTRAVHMDVRGYRARWDTHK